MDDRNFRSLLQQMTARLDQLERRVNNFPVRWSTGGGDLSIRLVKISDWTKNASGFYEVRPVRGEPDNIKDLDITNQTQSDLDTPAGFATDKGPQGMELGSSDEACVGLNLLEGNRSGAHVLRRNIYQIAIRVGASDNKDKPGRDVWMMVGPSPEHLFAVDLTKDGGADGDASSSTACTWTYTAKTKGGSDGNQKLGTSLTPERGRQFKASFAQATKGVGYYDGTDFKLWETNEVLSGQTNIAC